MTEDLLPVETLRKRCLRNTEIAQKTDFGPVARTSAKVVYPVSVSHITRNSLMSRHQALRLHYLVKFLKAGKILELGTSLGITTAFLAKASREAQVVTMEGCPELCEMAKRNLDILGIENVEILKGRFEDRLGEALLKLGKVDLLIIDGDHRKESVLSNMERARPYLHNDSVIVLDDIHLDKGMEEAWQALIGDPDVKVSIDLFFMGWLFLRKESSKEHFRLRYL